jgi:hypothetical protein
LSLLGGLLWLLCGLLLNGLCGLVHPITSPFPIDSSFENDFHDLPILTGSKLHVIERQYGGSLFHWNGALHVDITTRVDLGYAIMRLAG